MAKGLTQRQEIYCQQIILGKTSADAMRIAGYALKFAAQDGDKLLKNPKVQAKLLELRLAIQDSTIATQIRRKQRLSDIINHSIDAPVSAGHIIAATDKLNLMEHIYEPERGNTYNEIKIVVVYEGEKPKAIEQAIEGEYKEVSTSPIESPSGVATSPPLMR